MTVARRRGGRLGAAKHRRVKGRRVRG
jgi:hypothetical protein